MFMYMFVGSVFLFVWLVLDTINLSMIITVGEQEPVVTPKREREGDYVKLSKASGQAGEAPIKIPEWQFSHGGGGGGIRGQDKLEREYQKQTRVGWTDGTRGRQGGRPDAGGDSGRAVWYGWVE